MSNFFNIKQALALYGMLYCLGDTFIEEIYECKYTKKKYVCAEDIVKFARKTRTDAAIRL